MNVLAVVAHPDDELIGCGGTLRKLANDGHRVYSCILSAQADARHNRPARHKLHEVSVASSQIVGIEESVHHDFGNIRFNVVPHLEMVRAIEEAIVRFRPEWVFTHHPGDLNIDHRVCYETTAAAIQLPQRLSRGLPVTMIRKVLLFEVLSSTDWALSPDGGFRANTFVDIGTTLETKLEALRCFEGALKPYPHSRSEESIRALARTRGAQVGMEYAEAFCGVRDLYL